jgi:hypothetical protein
MLCFTRRFMRGVMRYPTAVSKPVIRTSQLPAHPLKGVRDGIADWFRDYFVHLAADLPNMTMSCLTCRIDGTSLR